MAKIYKNEVDWQGSQANESQLERLEVILMKQVS